MKKREASIFWITSTVQFLSLNRILLTSLTIVVTCKHARRMLLKNFREIVSIYRETYRNHYCSFFSVPLYNFSFSFTCPFFCYLFENICIQYSNSVCTFVTPGVDLLNYRHRAVLKNLSRVSLPWMTVVLTRRKRGSSMLLENFEEIVWIYRGNLSKSFLFFSSFSLCRLVTSIVIFLKIFVQSLNSICTSMLNSSRCTL